ncbi:MAG: hypothetical protein JW850_19650 [Thermoflexales bacterium]|nr:hypothetical protein [Thermoflexales bacterium]
MRVYKNQAYIKRQATLGKVFFWAALSTLVTGMVVSWVWPQYLFVPLVAMVAGLILARLGTFYLNRFVRPDRADVSLTAALKGFSDNYALYHYSSPASHVLLAPEGCYVFVTKLQDGKVDIKDGRGKQAMTFGRLLGLIAQEGIGDVAREATTEAESLEHHIAKHLPGAKIEVTPVVAFVHPNVQLRVESSSVPVLHAKQLKNWLRGPGKVKGLSARDHAQLVNLLGKQEMAKEGQAEPDEA